MNPPGVVNPGAQAQPVGKTGFSASVSGGSAGAAVQIQAASGIPTGELQTTVTSGGGAAAGVSLGYHPSVVLGNEQTSRLTLSGLAAVGVVPGQAPSGTSATGSVTLTGGPLLEGAIGGGGRETARVQVGGFAYGSYAQYLPVGSDTPQAFLSDAHGAGATAYTMVNIDYVGTTPRYVVFGEVSGRTLSGSVVGGPPLPTGTAAGSGSSSSGQLTVGGLTNFLDGPNQTAIPSVGVFGSVGGQRDTIRGASTSQTTWSLGIAGGVAF
jgi:hypothetical protein